MTSFPFPPNQRDSQLRDPEYEWFFDRGIDQFQLTLNFFLRHEILTPEAIKLFSDSQLYQLFKTYFSCPTDDETLTPFMDGYFYAFARWLEQERNHAAC